MKTGTIVAVLLLAAPASADAQRLSPEFARLPDPLPAPASSPKVAAVFGDPDDYRWEGALVGGIGLGLFGTYIAVGFCSDSEGSQNCVVSGILALVFGGIIGGGIGGLVGGLIPKDKL